MAGTRVGLEVGEPDLLLLGFHFKGQCLAIELAGHTEPGLLVVGSHGVVAGPGVFVGRLAGVVQAEAMDLTGREAADLEVEPLEVAAVGVRANGQVDLGRVTGIQDLDVAGIESAVDLQGGQRHGHWRGSLGFVVGGTVHPSRGRLCTKNSTLNDFLLLRS
ncbi:hypothetical protein D3C81_1267020 [compost metagenome]